MKTTLDRQHAGRITALDVDIVYVEPYPGWQGVNALLLSDGQEWFGCADCSAVAPRANSVTSHRKTHSSQYRGTRKRRTEKVTERVTETAEESVTIEPAGETVTTPAPRRRLVEQAPTYRRAQRPEDMIAIVGRWTTDGRDPVMIAQVVLSWIESAGDVNSAELARLALTAYGIGND